MNVWWRMYALKLVQLLLYGSCVNHWYMLLLLSVRVEEIISLSLRVKGFMRKGLSVCDRSFWAKTSPSATCSWILRRLSVSNKNWLLDVRFILNPLVQCLIWEPQCLSSTMNLEVRATKTRHYQNSHCFHGKLDRIGYYITDTIDWLVDSIVERIRWCWSDFETFEMSVEMGTVCKV